MRYQDLYNEWLESAIQSGGHADVVDKAINEYNAPTREAFDAWIQATEAVACSTCGVLFHPEGPAPFQEILCPNHAPRLAITPST